MDMVEKVAICQMTMSANTGHVMYSAIAQTLLALIFVHAEKAIQETAINAQI
jgi:hypothetical protein